MADGRHLEKTKTVISLQRLDRFAQNLARWCILALRRAWAVQILNFFKSKMADGGILKNCKRPYLRNGLTDLHKIRYEDAFWPSEGYVQLKFPTFRNPNWRTAATLKNKKPPYLYKALTDLHKIWHDDAYSPCEEYGQLGQLKFQNCKNSIWRTVAIVKNR